MRQASYAERDWLCSFLRTADDQEVDLVIDRRGMKTLVVEIESTTTIRSEHTEVVARLGRDIPESELLVLSRDPEQKQYGEVRCLHWREGIEHIFQS
jgi:hypothetical protein